MVGDLRGNAVCAAMNNITHHQAVMGRPGRKVFDMRPPVRPKGGGNGSAMDYSIFAFGFSISGGTVTIKAGEVHHGARPVVDVAEKAIALSVDHQYIWVEGGFGAGSIADPSTTRPVSDEGTVRVWIAKFRLVNGAASLETIGHLGNVYIGGQYG